MDISKQSKNGTLTLKVSGRIDTVTAPDFENYVNRWLYGINVLVLDFSNVNYISSAGLRVLLTLQKKMVKQGEMRIVNVNETVLVVFQVTGFDELLTIE